jgi:hypothetical protein
MLKQSLAKGLARQAALPIWQRDFFDHLLRTTKAMNKNRTTFEEIPSVPVYLRAPKNGHTPQK